MSKISQYTSATSLTGPETLVLVQSGNTRKIPVSKILTDPLFSHASVGSAGSVAAKLQQIISVKDAPYNAVGDGVTDDTAAFGSFYTALAASGGHAIIPPGAYLLTSQKTLTVGFSTPSIVIWAYGATLTTTGAISAFKITGSNVPQVVTVHGLNVNAVASQTAGFEATGTAILNLIDCAVEGVAASAGYIGFWLHQTDPADGNTGCFWTKLHRCNVRNNAGNIAHGIKLQGACNATHILGGTLSVGTGNCISLVNESGANDVANGVVVDGVSFEGFTLGVSSAPSAAGTTTGLRIVNCRAESGTTFFSLTTSTTQPAVPPFLAGNYLISSVTNYVANTNSIAINSWDFSVTPALNYGPFMRSPKTITFYGTDSAVDVAAIRIANTGSGQRWEDSSGGLLATFRWAASGVMELLGTVASGMFIALSRIAAISSTGTRRKNFIGNVTLSAGGTATVAFATAEPDANYNVYLSLRNATAGAISWNNATVNGFDVIGPASNVVFWMIIGS